MTCPQLLSLWAKITCVGCFQNRFCLSSKHSYLIQMEQLGDEAFYQSEDPSGYLLAEGNFLRFVELEYKRIAYDYYADVQISSSYIKHDLILAYDRYCSLYRAFENSLKKEEGKSGRPNQFKIAAALCFSLRRARPIAGIEASFEFARRMLENKLAGLNETAGAIGHENITPEFIYFYPLADEICAFEIGMRVAKHLTVQSAIAEFKNLGVFNPAVFDSLASHYQPNISKNDYTNVFITLRDHATSPYSLLVLYAAIFSKPIPTH